MRKPITEITAGLASGYLLAASIGWLFTACANQSGRTPPPQPSPANRWPLPDLGNAPDEPARREPPPWPPTPPEPEPPAARTTRSAPRATLATLEATTNAPDYVVLSKIEILDGTNKFSAELKGFKHPHVQADATSAVLIFPMRFTNYVLHATTNFGGFTNGQQIAAGQALGTNTALVWIDMHGGTKPMQFFWVTDGTPAP